MRSLSFPSPLPTLSERLRAALVPFLLLLVFILASWTVAESVLAKPSGLASPFDSRTPNLPSLQLGELYAERTLVIEVPDPCKTILARMPRATQGRKFSFSKNSLSGDLLFLAVCNQLKDDIRGAIEAKLKDISQYNAAKKKYKAAVEGAKKEIYNLFLHWAAEKIHAQLPPDVQARYKSNSPEMQDKALEWLNDPQHEVNEYINEFLESKSARLAELYRDYMSGGSWQIIKGLKAILVDAKEKLSRIGQVTYDVKKGDSPVADALKKAGFAGDFVNHFEAYEGEFNRLNELYSIVEAVQIMIAAFRTDDPAQKIAGLFDLLVVVGGAADKSKIPLVSLFGKIVKSFGEVGQLMLKQVLSLSKRIRNREGNCLGTATHAQRDERETVLVRDLVKPKQVLRICPIAKRGHLQDVYVSAQPDDATQLYFWSGDKFITGRKGGGGVMGMRRAIQLIGVGDAMGYKAYSGKSKDIGTIAMVYNTPYPKEDLRGRDRVNKTGVEGLLEEADKVIDEIASQINNLEGATDTFGENGCSEEKMRDYLKKETGKRIKEFINNYEESSRKLKDLYALAFVEKHRKNISGAPKKQFAYKTYSRFWDEIEKISLFKIRVILADKSRNDDKCPRCAGAKVEISVSNGKELAGCEIDKADSRGGFVTHIVTGKNTVTAKITAEAENKRGSIDIDPEKLFGGLGEVPFIHEESYHLEIPFEKEKDKEKETTKDDPNVVKGNEILGQLIAAAAEAERFSNELLTSCHAAQAKAGEASALMNQLKSEMSALKNQVDELTKKAAQVAQLASKVKSLADQANRSGTAAIKAKQDTENQALLACEKAEAIQNAPGSANVQQILNQAKAAGTSADSLSKTSAAAYKKARAAADQAAALVKYSAEMAGEISGLRKKTGELKSKTDSVPRLIGEARDAASKAASLNPSMDEITARGRGLFSQGTQAVEPIKETELGKEIIRKLNGALGRISAATARAGNCSAESEKTVDQVEKENEIFKAELEPLIAKALSLTQGAKPGESIEDLVADASAAADTAEIFSEAAAGSAKDARTCVQLAQALIETGSEKVSQTAQVAIDICDFKKAKGLIEALPAGPRKTRLQQAYLTKVAYEKQTKALFNAGKKLYKQGEFAAALTKFREAKSHTHCKNFIASLDAAIAKVIARKAELEKEKNKRQKDANATCNVRLSGSAARWNESSQKFSCACPSDRVKNANKTACILKTDVAQTNDGLDSEQEIFAVAFQMYILKPIHKPKTIKAPPGADKKTRERIKHQNKQIIKSYVSGLSFSNTRAVPMEKKQDPMFVAIGEGAWETYPREIFLRGAKFSAPMKGNLATGKGKSLPFDIAMLMTVTHVYKNMDEIFAAYPKAREQTQAKGGADLKQAMINDSTGTFTIDSSSGKMTFGPLARGWTSANKRKALQMTKLIASMSGECFVATAVYGDRYAPQLDTLRHFRDDFLLPTESGSRLVSLYYKYGPGLAGEVLKHPVIVSGLRKGLDIFVDWLEKKDQRDSLGGKVINGLANITDKILSMFTDETDYANLRQAPALPPFKIPNPHKPAR